MITSKLVSWIKSGFLVSVIMGGSLAIAFSNELPDLGDTSSSLVNPAQEQEIGQAWLRNLRTQARLVDDPLLNDYLYNLIHGLAQYSDLNEPDFDIIILRSKSFNAFAVPGGILGINAGVFLQTENEQELAAVFAHELAHLSQRHFARNLEIAKRNRLPQLAALLASVVIAAADGRAGMAALATTQAAIKQKELRYSRDNEQEADRIGIQTLVNAGKDPYAMPRVFETLQKKASYNGNEIPEFLLTHPLSESRIADSLNRAAQYENKEYPDNVEYHLMRARVILLFADNANTAVKRFRDELKIAKTFPEATRYGLAIALTRANQFAEADKVLAPLVKNDPDRPAFVIAKADIDYYAGRKNQAIELLKKNYEFNPENNAIAIRYAELLLKKGDAKTAAHILDEHTRHNPNNPNLWNLLAEANGLAKNIVGVHLARAEHFQLTGNSEKALTQLDYALKLVKGNFAETERIKQRKIDIKKIKSLRDAMKI